MMTTDTNTSINAPQATTAPAKEPTPAVIQDGNELGQEPKEADEKEEQPEDQDIAEDRNELNAARAEFEKDKADHEESKELLHTAKLELEDDQQKLNEQKDAVAKEQQAAAKDRRGAKILREKAAKKFAKLQARETKKNKEELVAAFGAFIGCICSIFGAIMGVISSIPSIAERSGKFAERTVESFSKVGSDPAVLEVEFCIAFISYLFVCFDKMDTWYLIMLFAGAINALHIFIPKFFSFICKD